MYTKKLQSRVELHIHLDGAARLSTIWQLSKKKGFPLPGDGSLQALIDEVVATTPTTLPKFLRGLKYTFAAVKGDGNAIEKIAYELCDDQAKQGVIYFENHYSPHLFADENFSPALVVEAVNRGFKRGEVDFKVKARSILSCVLGKPTEWCKEIVKLCETYRNSGVVGIDIAGGDFMDRPNYPREFIDAFLEAEKLGIHRTIHAGEAGPWEEVYKAIHDLHTERIGHGYHILDNEALYQETIKKDIHFEMCPHSSLLTGAVTQTTLIHPIIRLANDNANFSINSDDPALTNNWISNEIQLVQQWGFTEAHLIRSAFNAARSCFLPEDERKELIQQLKSIYGIIEV